MPGFARFNKRWASGGIAIPPSDAQSDAGFAYLGPAPPTVESFNGINQDFDEKDNWLFNQIDQVILSGLGVNAIEPDIFQLLNAINNIIANASIAPPDLTNYVLKSGDTMTGDLNVIHPPTANLHAASKQYVDQAVAGIVIPPVTGFLPLTGGQLSGPGNLDILGYCDVGNVAPADTAASMLLCGGLGIDPPGVWSYNIYIGSGGAKFIGPGYGFQFGYDPNTNVIGWHFSTNLGAAGGIPSWAMGRHTFTQNGDISLGNPSGNGYKPTVTGDFWGNYLLSTQSQVNDQDYTIGLAEIKSLRPVTFQVDDGGVVDPTIGIGLVMDEAIAAIPSLAINDATIAVREGEALKARAMNTGPVFYAMINAIKEIATRLDNAGIA